MAFKKSLESLVPKCTNLNHFFPVEWANCMCSRKLEREKTAFQNDREQQINRLRRQEDELNAIKLQESGLRHKVHEQKILEEKLITMRQELKESSEGSKVCIGNKAYYTLNLNPFATEP